MNKNFFFSVTLVMVLAFGMAVVEVEAQSNNGGIDGMWNFSDEGIWKFEKGELIIFDDDGEFNDEASYTIKGNTLILDNDDEIKFSIRGNTLTLTIDGETLTGTKISESQSPVGRWVPERGQRVPNSFPDSLELTSDGKGIGDGMGLNWKVENSRITLNLGVWGAYAYYYIIYGSKLILTKDKDCISYVKRR